jgi:hypothetical protein
MTNRALLVLAFSLLIAPGISHAHESRPGYLEVREISEARYDVLWKQPARGEMVLRLNPVLPASCVQLGLPPASSLARGIRSARAEP